MMIDNPNNIFYLIKYKNPEDLLNEDLQKIDGIYPKCFTHKDFLLKFISEKSIEDLENRNLLEFYKETKLIKWKDLWK